MIVVACALVFGQSAGFDFILFDDQLHTFENPFLNPPSWAGLAHLWQHPYEQLYVPLAYTLFALLAVLAQAPHPERFTQTGAPFNPHVFHVTNITLHACSALLVFFLLRRIVTKDLPALTGALLFALHPLQVESVAWISELRGLLAALLCLASLTAYTKQGWPRYALATFLFVLALLAKPSAVALPLIAVPVDALINRRSWKQYVIEIGPWLAIAAVFLLLTRGVQTIPPAALAPIARRPLVAAGALAFYAGKTIAPLGLAVDYGRTPSVILSRPRIWAEALGVIAAVVCAWFARKRWPWAAAAAIVWAAGLLPVLGLAPFAFESHSVVADRYAYLSLFGPALALAVALAKTRVRWPFAVAGIALVMLGALAHGRCGAWKSTISIMRAELGVNPNSSIGLVNIGNAYVKNGEPRKAEAYLRREIQLDPRSSLAHLDLGNALVDEGRTAEALTEYDDAIAIEPTLRKAHYDRGIGLMNIGDLTDAIAEFDNEIALTGYPPARVNKGIVLIELRRPAEAIPVLQQAIASGRPTTSWYTNLALAQAMTGHVDDASASIAKALAIDPADRTALSIRQALAREQRK